MASAFGWMRRVHPLSLHCDIHVHPLCCNGDAFQCCRWTPGFFFCQPSACWFTIVNHTSFDLTTFLFGKEHYRFHCSFSLVRIAFPRQSGQSTSDREVVSLLSVLQLIHAHQIVSVFFFRRFPDFSIFAVELVDCLWKSDGKSPIIKDFRDGLGICISFAYIW